MNTTRDSGLILIPTEGTEGKIARLRIISLKKIALAISEKKGEIELAPKMEI
ncbi:MAG: hypothetical protein QW292_10190 [Candidatus Parvarchaeota archaeon]